MYALSNLSPSDGRLKIGPVQVIYILFVLFYFAIHGIWPIIEQRQGEEWGFLNQENNAYGAIDRVTLLVVWGGGVILFIKAYRHLVKTLLTMKVISAIPLVALASVVWSDDRSKSLHSAPALVFTTLFAFYFASRLAPETQLRLLMITGLIIAAASAAFALLLPEYGIDHGTHVGAWQGIFNQKNVLSRVLIFLLAPSFAFLSTKGPLRIPHIVAIALLYAVTIMSNSRTGMAFLALYPLLIIYLRLIGRLGRASRAIVFACSVFGIVITFWLLSMNLSYLLSSIGRDSTLTGRTDIWKLSLQAIMKRPFLGYGYNAFWGTTNGPSFNIVLALRWAVPGGHNGFVDVCLSLGLLGLGLVAMSMVSATKHALEAFHHDRSPYVIWCILTVLITVLYSLDEGFIVQGHQLLWALYIVACVGLSNASRQSNADHRKIVREIHEPSFAPAA